jgi:hypothetical protein
VQPTLLIVTNSSIPVSFNDGPLWAGRGVNVLVNAGAVVDYGRLRVTVAPYLAASQNLQFPLIGSTRPDRSRYSSPWHQGEVSADLPTRFGNRHYARIDPGESALELNLASTVIGLSTGSQWWGPGVRNAIVMSDNAAGIPRAFVRTGHPIRTRWFSWEAAYEFGTLEESPFFDRNDDDDLRSLSAAIVTLTPAIDSNLTIGIARAVFATDSGAFGISRHFPDVLLNWSRTPTSGPVTNHHDQITSLFARWTFPSAGIAVYGEWAKLRPPESTRELFVDPQRGQGFTIGSEWATRLDRSSVLHLTAEATNLEQTPVFPGAETLEFYASRSVAHGYTQQGQVVGAGIGPGASSQYLAADVLGRTKSYGLSLGRIRWEEDAYYRDPSPGRFAYKSHDVSLFAELRGSCELLGTRLEFSTTVTRRLNFMFQTANPFVFDDAFDVVNLTTSLRIIPGVIR